MKQFTKNAFLALFLSAAAANVSANDYTVQVGAYKSLTNEEISKAERHGDVYKSVSGNNLTRLHVGRYTTRAEAVAKRKQLVNSGYSDAFITRISVSEPAATTSFSSSYAQEKVTQQKRFTSAPSDISKYQRKAPSQNNLSGLNADEKSKAAFLDGKLRIVSNGNFYTLEQYRQQK